jgi:tetratricopeptide (TPR) repeat protein
MLHKAVRDFDSAITLTDRKDTETNAAAHLNRAFALKELFRFDDAIDDFKRYVEVIDDLGAELDPECYIGIGDCYFMQQKFAQASNVSRKLTTVELYQSYQTEAFEVAIFPETC